MDKESTILKGAKVLERIQSASKILIVPDASRVDYDCLGTAIALKKWLVKQGKDARVYLFGKMPNYLQDFEIIKGEVDTKFLKEVDFNFYDLVFLVDTNDWDRVLTRDYSKVLNSTNSDKFINIDHHNDGTILKDIPENVINFHDVCAGKVLYDALIKPSGIELDKEIAQALYLSLAGDTAIFKFIEKDTFEYAQTLINYGAEHANIADFVLSFSKGAIDYFRIAVENTHYYPELKLTVLAIDEKLYEQLNTELNEKWINDDYSEFYKEYFQRRIEGYDYGIIFRWDPDSKGSRISYRTKSSGETLELLPILQSLGFKAGGHRNAGGGFAPLKASDAEAKFVEEVRKNLNIS